jgi:aromatic ring-opening dioxygenase LigB subunit
VLAKIALEWRIRFGRRSLTSLRFNRSFPDTSPEWIKIEAVQSCSRSDMVSGVFQTSPAIHNFLFHWILILVVQRRSVAILYRAAILPHGDEAFDPTRFAPGTESRRAADHISKAAHDTGWWLRDGAAPLERRDAGRGGSGSSLKSLLLVSSPHGVTLSNDFAVYVGGATPIASGMATIGATDDPLYTVHLDSIGLASARALDLIAYLNHPNVTGFDLADTPLRWGEVIPLLFTKQRTRNHLFWTYPLRRFNESVAMIPELLDIGQRLGRWFDSLPEEVSIIISGDLAHRHRADGPYGYSNASQPMDEALGRWATSPCENANDLLQTAASLQNQALSCGFTGFVLLHGVLCGDYPWVDKWTSQVLVNRNATYFGMMVAQFERRIGAERNSASSQ